MKTIAHWLAGLALAALTLGGCAGTDATKLGEVSGVIYDANGNVVRGARVWVEGGKRPQTYSNSSGAFVLTDVNEGDNYIQAEVSIGGIHYIGQNVATVFGRERSKSVNIGVYRDNQLAGIEGIVKDRFGGVVEGARVFASSENGLSSSVAVSDRDGYYIIDRLQAGVNFELNAGGRGFDSDRTRITPVANRIHRVDFILGDAADPLLAAPTNLTAVAWTSKYIPTTTRTAYLGVKENIARLLDGNRRQPKIRVGSKPKFTLGGNHVEVDLTWDYVDDTALLGYGVYRARSAFGASTAIDFLRDPFAWFYQDLDDDLIEGSNYYYEITALTSQYPDTANSESNPSARYGVATLGDMNLMPIRQTPLTFRWEAATGAESYIVYLFDRYPSLGVDPIWSNSGTPTTNLELPYTGGALQSGRQYFYLVLGVANNFDSRTISEVDDFVKN